MGYIRFKLERNSSRDLQSSEVFDDILFDKKSEKSGKRYCQSTGNSHSEISFSHNIIINHYTASLNYISAYRIPGKSVR